MTADPDRRLLTRAQIVEEHFTTTGLPVGHGFTEREPRRRARPTTPSTAGRVRFVVLDTVNPNGVRRRLARPGPVRLAAGALAARDRQAVVVVSATTRPARWTNPLVGTGGDPSPRVLGDEVVAVLLATRSVIAWVNGHTHRNQITAAHAGRRLRRLLGDQHRRRTSTGRSRRGSSRCVDNEDGTLSIFTTIVDHAGPAAYGGDLSTVALAAPARELAANDWQGATSPHGRTKARNIELLVKRPAWMA